MTTPMPQGVFAKALQDKRARQRRRKLILAASIVGGVLVIALVLGAVLFSPWLAARQVEVTGQSLLTKAQVKDAAAVPAGTSLLLQDLGGIRDRVAALPAVREAQVTTVFPNTIHVAVTEREAVYERRVGGRYDWVDAEGVVFHQSPKPTKGAVQVTTSTTDKRLLADIATVVDTLPSSVRGKLKTISATAVDRIELSLADGRKVMWGSADEADLKAEVLTALLAVEASVYDVSAPLHPTTR